MSRRSQRKRKQEAQKKARGASISPPPGSNPSHTQIPSVTAQGLSDARKAQLEALREFLGDRPEGFSPEEWNVVHALVDPDRFTFSITGIPLPRIWTGASRAKACFPGETLDEAMRLFKNASRRPHVLEVVNAIRSLELLDVVEQRAQVRAALHSTMAMHTRLQTLVAQDPSAAAKVGLAVVAASKALMALDGLAVTKEELEPPPSPTSQLFSAASELDSVLADLQSRKPVVDVEAEEV